jgi:hypothetical protein
MALMTADDYDTFNQRSLIALFREKRIKVSMSQRHKATLVEMAVELGMEQAAAHAWLAAHKAGIAAAKAEPKPSNKHNKKTTGQADGGAAQQDDNTHVSDDLKAKILVKWEVWADAVRTTGEPSAGKCQSIEWELCAREEEAEDFNEQDFEAWMWSDEGHGGRDLLKWRRTLSGWKGSW